MGVTLDEKALGQRLQLARKRAKLTQQELCQKAGLSYSTLAKIERGAIKSPSVFTVAAIADATGTTMEKLLDIRLSANPDKPSKKRSKKGVSFVYFDLDGVIVRNGAHAFAAIARERHLEPEVVENSYWRYNDAVCRGDLSVDEFNAKVAKELGVKSFDWLKHYAAVIEATPGVADLVKWAAENYEIGLISNHMLGQTELLKRRKLIPKVEYKAIIDSCDVKCIKPEAKIYKLAEELSGVGPEEILLVDDMRPNLTGADQHGWHIQHFDTWSPKDSISRVKQTLEF